ncbi:hypothetical protein Q5P01_002836 [Channa striata]|uniref:Uncharacterized protein n=1 Tax=Channa striata TaxID=64152 RepID=A0AA88P1L3_CHASR|nr:hypothetical protein Q5P01_002836 [Channa striata]
MTSLKTWCLLSLSVLLLLSIAPTEAKVVQSMSECKGFLLKENPPRIPGILTNYEVTNPNRYKIICQTMNQRRFVTLYDTRNKIPVFSAYKYRGSEGKRPNEPWKTEPQLEDLSNMWIGTFQENNQASNNDYKNNQDYNRGQLFPAAHAFDQNDKISTFTLTNVVPQAKTFNQWQLGKNGELDNVPEGFVVTGAKPGTETLNQKVNIPSVLWSAFCCYSKKENKWLSGAHWGNNVAENSTSKYLETKTLEELRQELDIRAFPNAKHCPLTENVSEFYPVINQDNNCQCPPQASTTPAPPTVPLSPNISTTTVPTTDTSTTIVPTTTTVTDTTTTAPPTVPSTSAASTLSPNISTTTVQTTDTSTTIVPTTTTVTDTTTTAAPPTAPSTTAASTLSPNISTTTVPTTDTSTTIVPKTTTVTDTTTTAAPPTAPSTTAAPTTVFFEVVNLLKTLILILTGQAQKVLTASQTTTSPFTSTLGQTTTFIHSAIAPIFNTTTPTSTETPTTNVTLTSTALNIAGSLQSNATANKTTAPFSIKTQSQRKPPRHQFSQENFPERIKTTRS